MTGEILRKKGVEVRKTEVNVRIKLPDFYNRTDETTNEDNKR